MQGAVNGSSVEITILVDNCSPSDLIAEHGLAIHIESDGRQILFDTGQGGALAHNSRSLGVALDRIDAIVLSHGHYDHTGGLAGVLQSRGVDLYCHPAVTQPRYAIRNGEAKPIHISSAAMRAIAKLPEERLNWVSAPRMLSAAIGITGTIPRKTGFEDAGGPFYLDPEGHRSDPLDDDMALFIRTPSGVVVCTGCCHAGLVNTLNLVRHLTANAPVLAVIGGLHLLNAGSRRLEETITALRSLSPRMVVPCHCTGEHAIAMLSDALGPKVLPGAAGLTLRF